MKNSLINFFLIFWFENKASSQSSLSNKFTIFTNWLTANWSNFVKGKILFPVLSFNNSVKIKKIAHNLRSFLAGFVLIFKILNPDLWLIV